MAELRNRYYAGNEAAARRAREAQDATVAGKGKVQAGKGNTLPGQEPKGRPGRNPACDPTAPAVVARGEKLLLCGTRFRLRPVGNPSGF
jgi:hypothetical protein